MNENEIHVVRNLQLMSFVPGDWSLRTAFLYMLDLASDTSSQVFEEELARHALSDDQLTFLKEGAENGRAAVVTNEGLNYYLINDPNRGLLLGTLVCMFNDGGASFSTHLERALLPILDIPLREMFSLLIHM